MKREFHWFQDYRDLTEYYTAISKKEEACICYDIYRTGKAINFNNYQYILSTQSHYFSQDTIDKNYRLIAHFSSGDIVEVKRGKNYCTTREISCFQNLEKLLLAGEFGGDFECLMD